MYIAKLVHLDADDKAINSWEGLVPDLPNAGSAFRLNLPGMKMHLTKIVTEVNKIRDEKFQFTDEGGNRYLLEITEDRWTTSVNGKKFS